MLRSPGYVMRLRRMQPVLNAHMMRARLSRASESASYRLLEDLLLNNASSAAAHRVRITGVVVFGAFLALLNQTVMSPALPVIMADFAIDASTAQWIMSIYPLVSGIMVPVSAFLIDRFTTRQLFFAATGAFAAGTALCAAAPTFFLLICGRVLQAAASGVLLPLVSVVPMLVFPVEKRGTAMGMAGIVMSAGPAIGPVVGGAIIDAYGWRACLGCIVPLAPCLVHARCFCSITSGKENALISTWRPSCFPPWRSEASCTVFPAPPRWDGRAQWCSGASSQAWPAWRCSRAVSCTLPSPLLDLRCLRSGDFAVAAIVVTLINAACLVTNTILPILLQTAMGATALQTGMAMLPAAAVGILISPISGVVFDKFGPRAISVGGLALMTVSLFALSRMDASCSILMVAILCAAQAAGQSLANMPVNTWGINALENSQIAHGNAIANTGRQVAGGLGTAIIVTLMTTVTSNAALQGAATVQATVSGTSAAYMACSAIGLMALIFGVLKIRVSKEERKQPHVIRDTAANTAHTGE